MDTSQGHCPPELPSLRHPHGLIETVRCLSLQYFYALSASHHVTLHPRPAVLPAPVAERAESAQGCS